MGDTIRMQISVPTDNEGYVLLRCQYCGNYFKLIPNDYQDDGVLEVFCPCCGLTSDNYLTDDVIELAMTMFSNAVSDILYNQMKSLERHTKKSLVSISAGKKPKHERENPIRAVIDSLEAKMFLCCKKNVKVKPLLIMTGCYCPFCGVKSYENE